VTLFDCKGQTDAACTTFCFGRDWGLNVYKILNSCLYLYCTPLGLNRSVIKMRVRAPSQSSGGVLQLLFHTRITSASLSSSLSWASISILIVHLRWSIDLCPNDGSFYQTGLWTQKGERDVEAVHPSNLDWQSLTLSTVTSSKLCWGNYILLDCVLRIPTRIMLSCSQFFLRSARRKWFAAKADPLRPLKVSINKPFFARGICLTLVHYKY